MSNKSKITIQVIGATGSGKSAIANFDHVGDSLIDRFRSLKNRGVEIVINEIQANTKYEND